MILEKILSCVGKTDVSFFPESETLKRSLLGDCNLHSRSAGMVVMKDHRLSKTRKYLAFWACFSSYHFFFSVLGLCSMLPTIITTTTLI